MALAIGSHVRFVNTGNRDLDGRVVVIRAFRVCAEGLPPWPCFEDRGEMWPFNPDWVATTSQHASQDVEQMPLFGAAVG